MITDDLVIITGVFSALVMGGWSIVRKEFLGFCGWIAVLGWILIYLYK